MYIAWACFCNELGNESIEIKERTADLFTNQKERKHDIKLCLRIQKITLIETLNTFYDL